MDTLAKTLRSFICSVAIENPNFDLLASYAKVSEHPLFSLRALLKSSNLQTEQREMINKLVEDRQTINYFFHRLWKRTRLIAPVILRNQISSFPL